MSERTTLRDSRDYSRIGPKRRMDGPGSGPSTRVTLVPTNHFRVSSSPDSSRPYTRNHVDLRDAQVCPGTLFVGYACGGSVMTPPTGFSRRT